MTSGSGARYRASPSAPLYRNRWLPDRVLRFRLRDFRDVRRVRLQRGMLFKHCTKLFCTHSIFWRYGIAHTRTRLRVPAVPPRSEERGPRFPAEVKKTARVGRARVRGTPVDPQGPYQTSAPGHRAPMPLPHDPVPTSERVAGHTGSDCACACRVARVAITDVYGESPGECTSTGVSPGGLRVGEFGTYHEREKYRWWTTQHTFFFLFHLLKN